MSRIVLCSAVVSVMLFACDAGRATADEGKEAPAASPEVVSWSYLDAGYAYTKYGNDTDTTFGDLSSLDDANGLGLALSYGFKKHFHLTADYSWGEGEEDGGTDLTKVFAGLGGHYSIIDSVDVYGDLGYALYELGTDTPDGDERDDGVSVRAGIRGFVMPAAELGFRAAYADLEGHSLGTGRVSAHYYLTNMIAFALSVDYDTDEMLTVYTGFRLDITRDTGP